MSTATGFLLPEGDRTPREVADAVRTVGAEGLTDFYSEVGETLQDLARDPATVFATDGVARGTLTVMLETLQAVRGALDALEARTVIAVRDVTRRERMQRAREAAARGQERVPSETAVHRVADGVTTRDVSLLTRRSPHGARRTMASAQRLVDAMPAMLAALGDGTLGADAVYAVADAGAVLDPETLASVDRELGKRLADIDAAGTRQVRRTVATIAAEVDPQGEPWRHRRSVRRRRVTVTEGAHGMATLSAHLPALDAELIRKQLSLSAEQARSAGSREGHSALMADELVRRLLGREGAAEPVTLEVGVIITDRALFHPEGGDIAHLEGYGPVPAEEVRAQLRAATTAPGEGERDPFGQHGPEVRAMIRRLYTHPTTGELVAMDARSRLFPSGMKRFLSWRDTSCRGPFCNASICQADHIVPHARGGPTSLDNGQGVCLHCNQKEEDAAWVRHDRTSGRPGHRVTWAGRSGILRTTAPAPLIWHRGAGGRGGRADGSGAAEGADPDGDP
ncbi:HNH endonuclease [Brachybacterium sp. YJGR34]|uniref:HNH endonuclease n=1 Tax=Brachybacterium sp. YJGR34 TaxID=2059911 RepID=UPI0018E5EFB8|nr:HNH endonuclease [Brachybacterium sp. YJGR34]